MEYTLVKELKEHGFPQNLNDGNTFWLGASGSKVVFTSEEWSYLEENDYVKAPTLSELIEECGGEYHDFMLKWRGGYWWCVASIGEFPDMDWCQGDSPEEAVARLWLQINRK